jgi:hypothetical protein
MHERGKEKVDGERGKWERESLVQFDVKNEAALLR